jgi:uncharacterized membrane protein
MGEPIFLFVGAYDKIASAEGDYEVIKILRSVGEIGSCDAAVIAKPPDGEVELHKTEAPTGEGAWIGLAASAGGAMACPDLLPALLGSGASGAGIGAWHGHLSSGTSRADAEEIGALLGHGRAALIVVGLERDAGRIQQTAVEASASTVKHLPDSDFDEAERDAIEAMARA